MSSKSRAAVVVPVFNRAIPIRELLFHICACASLVTDVVIVDHGDKPVDLPSPNGVKVHVLRRSSRLWFTAAANEGLRFVLRNLSGVSVVVLCNDDIQVRNESTINELVRSVTSNFVVAVPAIRPDSTILYAGVHLSRATASFRMLGAGAFWSPNSGSDTESDVLPTRLIAFPREQLRRVGLLSETYLPQYGSDYEWTRRLRSKGVALKVLWNYPVVTVQNESTANRGRQPYRPPIKREFRARFLSLHEVGSLRSEFHFSRLAFRFPYSVYWLSVNAARVVAGFVVGVIEAAIGGHNPRNQGSQ